MLNNQVIILLFLWITISSCTGLKLPATFQRCKVSPELDGKPNECMLKAMNSAILTLSSGIKELSILPLDPLKISEMKIEQGGTNPVAIKLRFNNCDLFGTSGTKVTELKGQISSPDGFHLKAKLSAPVMTITGPYEISGKVLIIPIQGTGDSNITLYDADYRLDMKGEKQVKNGEDYLKITDFKLKILDPKGMTLQFDNLFNGDKALGDNTNRFLNENWKDIFLEVRPAIEKAFGAVYEAYSKTIMERIAFKDIFITE